MQNLQDLHIWQDETDSDRVIFAWPPKVEGKSTREHSIDNTGIYISGSICDYPHLELTEKSWFVSRYFKSINMGKSQRNECKGISKHPFQILL